MKISNFNEQHREFYHNLKKSLQNQNKPVLGTNNRNIDFIVIDMTKDIQLFKIVTPYQTESVSFWVEHLKRLYKLAWFRANYTLIYIDEDGIEVKRDTILLN